VQWGDFWILFVVICLAICLIKHKAMFYVF